MAKSVWAVIVIVALVVIGGALYFTNKDSNNGYSSTTPNNSTDMNNKSNQQASTAPTATDKVSIKDMTFTPADITVKVGSMVTWTNNDSIAHTVTADVPGDGAPDSPSIEPGKTYTFEFSKAGTYTYHCSIHPNMTGKVTVTE